MSLGAVQKSLRRAENLARRDCRDTVRRRVILEERFHVSDGRSWCDGVDPGMADRIWCRVGISAGQFGEAPRMRL